MVGTAQGRLCPPYGVHGVNFKQRHLQIHADTASRSRRSFARGLILNRSPSEDQRAQGMPGARCARSLACKSESSTHASRHGHTGNTRHSPRNGLRLISRSPRGPGSFAPVVRRTVSHDLNASVGAPGPHDFAVRFKRPRQKRHQRPPHPAANVRDDRETPLWEAGRQGICD